MSVGRTRGTKFGSFTRQIRGRSSTTQLRFAPTDGFTEQTDLTAPPGSITSGQNIWIRDGELRPRDRLTPTSSTPLGDEVNGSFVFNDISGVQYPMVTSKDTVVYLSNGEPTKLTYVSGASNLPPTGAENDDFFGDSIYLTRNDLNLAVFTNGVDPIFAWGGPSDGTGYSTLSQAPICNDLAVFDDRVVTWNIQELSSNSRFVTRVQWCPAGAPENWSTLSVGAGFQDLLGMRGKGTRIFAEGDELLLASDAELWRGRSVGLPFVFDFEPVTKQLGIPFKRGALQTLDGIFWIGEDYEVYQFYAGRINKIATAIRDTLRNEITDLSTVAFGYDSQRRQLTLYYASTKAWTFHLEEGHWTPQRFAQSITYAGDGKVASSGTTWGGLQGTLAQKTLTYNQYLGLSDAPQELVFSSDGTIYKYSSDATNDDGSAFTAQAVLGASFAGDPDSIKLLDELRIDWRAGSASTLTVGVSGDLGASYATRTPISISARSATSQDRINPMVSGDYFTLELTGDASNWGISAIHERARIIGRSL